MNGRENELAKLIGQWAVHSKQYKMWVSKMSEELSREIRKLEVRLKEFVKEEKVFVQELTICLTKFKTLNTHLNRCKTEPSHKIGELMKLKLEAIDALSMALKKGSDAEHERSHLLESYGALVLASERDFEGLLCKDPEGIQKC